MRDQLRVAAAQFATTQDVDANLATVLRMIAQAASTEADLVVLPEFCNHISVYDSAEHCRDVAVPLDGPWMQAIADAVRDHEIHLVINVTVPRDDERVTVTSLLLDPAGTIVATADKQTLMGNERTYLSGGTAANLVAETDFGRVGLYSCMDGVTFETPRGFAVRGARLLANSLNSFARDEAALHIPVRAVENGVFVVAANKIGPLLPPDQVNAFSEQLGVPRPALDGAGESQIVSPEGVVLAKAPRGREGVIHAAIDLSEVGAHRPRLADRRPEIYGPLARPDNAPLREPVPASMSVRCVSDSDFAQHAVDGSSQLVVLPELTPVPAIIPPDVHVVTTAVVDGRHEGQVWTQTGLAHSQPQLHPCARHSQALGLGDEVSVLRTPWGDLAVLVGDDHRYPEAFRLAAIAGAHVVAVCYQPEYAWEVDLALRERAAENRLCVAASAGRSDLRATVVLNPPADSLWSPERARPYDGTINTPAMVVAGQGAEMLDAQLHPQRALDREISRDTDLVGGRSWQASSVLVV